MSPLLKRKSFLSDDKYTALRYSFISAGFAFIIMMIFYIIHNNTLAFGDNTVLRMDLYHQYGPLYAEVYDRITQGNSLVYSWTSGLGATFLGNFFNYCSSPFALIMLIFGHKNMPEAIAVMLMLKAMLAAFSFTYYVNKSNDCAKKESIVFGLLYAFSGYFVAFSWNIMWFDAVAVFPFVILGIERIIQKNKPCMYIAAMTYTMVTNYYMAYMVCILSVMYFIYFYFGRYELSSKIYKPLKEPIVVAPVVDDKSIDESDDSENECVNESFPAEEEPSDKTEIEGEFVKSFDIEDKDSPLSIESIEKTILTEKLSEDSTNPVDKDSSEDCEKSAYKKKKKERKFTDNRFWVTGWSFALSSFLCFALAAFALLPVYYCLQTSSATGGTFPEDWKQYFDIFTFIANHLPGVEATIRSSGNNVIPNVYCGLLTVLMLPIYFLSEKIPGKQKVVSAVLLISCFCGFVLNYFNFIWHGFHMPNDLPYRWSFAYSFFLLIIAFKAFGHIKEFSNKTYVGIGFTVFIFLILVEKIGVPNCDELTIVLGVVFAILYIVIFGMLKSERYKKNSIIALLFFTVILEIVAADAPKIVMQQPKDAYTSDYNNYQSISDSVDNADDELFYRTELTKLRTRMDASWYGYNGVSVFSSMAYEHTAKVMENLGLFGNDINSYTYYPQTPIFNSMFNIKYLYDNKDFIQNDDMYTLVAENEDFEAFRYNYYLPLILSVSEGIKEWDDSSPNPFTVQNKLMESATGITDILIPVDATNVSKENLGDISLSSVNGSTSFTVSKSNKGSDGKAFVSIKPSEPGNYYVYIGSTKLSGLKIEAGELEYNYNSSSIQPFILDLGYLDTEDEAVIQYTVASSYDSASLTFCAARLDEEKFKEAYSIIKNNGTFDMTSFEETSLSGTINVKNNDALLWTSVPYDESWEITVDGKVLSYSTYDEETDELMYDGEIEKIGGGLIGIEIEPGVHSISFRYKAKGLSTGLIMTLAGIIVVLLLIVFKVLYDKKIIGGKLIPFFFRKPDFHNI